MEEDNDEKKERQKLNWNSIKSVFQNSIRINKVTWKEHCSLVIFNFIAIILTSSIPFIQARLNGSLIDLLINFTKTNILAINFGFILAGYILINFVSLFARSTEDYVTYLFYKFFEETYSLMIIKKKGELDIATHEKPNFNNFANKIDEIGVWHIQNFSDRQFYILQNLIRIIIASVIVFKIRWWLLIVIFVGNIPNILKEVKYGQRIWSIWDADSELRRKFTEYRNYFTSITNLSEIKLHGSVNFFYSRIKDLLTQFQRKLKIEEKRKYFSSLLSDSFSQITISFVTIYFIFEVIHGHISIGNLTFLLISISNFHVSFGELFMFVGRQYQDNLFINDFFKLLDTKSELDFKQDSKTEISKNPKIEYQNVWFKYPGTDNYILKNFSLTINSGEKIAIIGVNGAGKTTLIKLLCRFYDPTKGKILIDGINLKDLNIDTWLDNLSILSQEFIKYSLLTKEAIGVSDIQKNFDIDTIIDAAKSSEADQFINTWESKYDQMLGKVYKDGKELSIGQWQKMALARIFYRNRPIMVLDEPTASIDAEAEQHIFKRLTELSKTTTAILISHRFSTVRHADKICVIEDGILSEYGTHNELMHLQGTYARLFNLQAEGYK